MILKNNKHGWGYAPDETAIPYIEVCKLIASDNEVFSSFRKNKCYSKILSGGEKIVGENAIININKLGKLSVLIKNLEQLRKNDHFGGPQTHQYDDLGEIDPSTLKYFNSAMEITELVGDFCPTKIIEVGAGYGGLCRVLSIFFDFEEYVIVDLPEVIHVSEKYLSNFPELKGKVKFVSCDNLDSIHINGDIDLFIADSSLAELDLERQKKYTQKLAAHGKFIYVFWNTLHFEKGLCDQKEFINSFDRNYKLNIRNVCMSGDLIYMWENRAVNHKLIYKESAFDKIKSLYIRIRRYYSIKKRLFKSKWF